MTSLRRGISRFAGSIALLAMVAPAVWADIPLALRFNGEPLTVAAAPEFTCFSYTANRWLNCAARRANQPGEYSLPSLPPGKISPI